MLDIGKPYHLTNKVRKLGTHPDETVFESVLCVKPTMPKPEEDIGIILAGLFGVFLQQMVSQRTF